MQHSRHRKGMVIVYAAVFMVALLGVVSLAVDWGRVQTAKTELQDAADAAARNSVTGIRDNTTFSRAQAVALSNKVDGSALSLNSTDVEVGTWDTVGRTFTVGGSNQNAVRVWGRRTAARGTAVPLLFAKAIGRTTCDVTAISIASQEVLPYSVVALNSVTMSNTSYIQRKLTESLLGNTVIVASNGTYSIGALGAIYGNALYRNTAPSGNITGSKTAMGSDLSYGVVSAPTGVASMGALSYTSGALYNISGVYVCSACTLGGSFVLSLNGDLTLYCSGNVSFASNVNVITNGYKMTIYMTGPGTISFTNTLPVSAIVYGPNAAMTVNAAGKITGSFVAKSLNMTAGTIEYTSNLPIPVAPSGGGSASAVGGVSTVR